MFRYLVSLAGFNNLLEWHPTWLALTLEWAWQERANRGNATGLRHAPLAGIADGVPPPLSQWLLSGFPPFPPAAPQAVSPWPHLIYAYMIENTRIYEIFRKVLWEFAHTERLEPPTAATQAWLRATEDLFYSFPPAFPATGLTSSIRPDIRATRRNAYYRMFGMDLNHGADGGGPYPYEKPKGGANVEFVTLFEGFLREVWRAMTNFNNTSGENFTDPAGIMAQAEQLGEILRLRRRNGNLSRDEFVHVAAMSWFHLTVDGNTPVVIDLKAQAESPEDRLRKIGERVGVPAHSRAESFFVLANTMSPLLLQVENRDFDNPAGALTLYAAGSPVEQNVRRILTHWSKATGRDYKARSVSVSDGLAAPSNRPPQAAQPRRVTNGAAMAR
jgi:hypothetical protein